MSNPDHLFWETIYRALLSIAGVIKRNKLGGEYVANSASISIALVIKNEDGDSQYGLSKQ